MLKKFKRLLLEEKLGLLSLFNNKAGISSVIQTVLITAIGVVIAIAAMLWINGLTSSLMRYEKIGVTSHRCYLDADEDVFKIQIRLKNTGASTQINNVFVNNVPLEDLENVSVFWMVENGDSGNGLPIPVRTGVNVDLNLVMPDGTVSNGGVLTSGVTVNIMLHSVSGANYLVNVNLP